MDKDIKIQKVAVMVFIQKDWAAHCMTSWLRDNTQVAVQILLQTGKGFKAEISFFISKHWVE